MELLSLSLVNRCLSLGFGAKNRMRAGRWGAFLHISGIRALEAAAESPQPWRSRVCGRGLTRNPASTPVMVPPPAFLQRANLPLHLLPFSATPNPTYSGARGASRAAGRRGPPL